MMGEQKILKKKI